MGNKTPTSWFKLVKRAFRSPNKDNPKKSSKEQEDEGIDKTREKRRWLFWRSNNHTVRVEEAKDIAVTVTSTSSVDLGERQAAAMAAAAAVAEAAATAQAAILEIVSLGAKQTKPSNVTVKQQWAAILIQTSFRGYLARRALRALKGLVKLQALIRGHNVRNQTKLVLKYMEALVRVQDRVRYQRARLSHECERTRKHSFAENGNGLYDLRRYSQDLRNRNSSYYRDIVSSTLDNWDDLNNNTSEDIEAAIAVWRKRKAALANAFSGQRCGSGIDQTTINEKELTRWLDQWMVTEYGASNRAARERRDTGIIKTVEIDETTRPSSSSRRSLHCRTPSSYRSPSSITPSPCKSKPLKDRSASPRCLKEEFFCHSTSHTPSLGSRYCTKHAASIPNYMAATKSAKARIRSHSTPRHRPSMPEREQISGTAKKRLLYPDQMHNVDGGGIEFNNVDNCRCHLRSPSIKSVQCGHYGMELRSNYSSSMGGEISPCSTTDLPWLK